MHQESLEQAIPVIESSKILRAALSSRKQHADSQKQAGRWADAGRQVIRTLSLKSFWPDVT
jgi:hypothetical protein